MLLSPIGTNSKKQKLCYGCAHFEKYKHHIKENFKDMSCWNFLYECVRTKFIHMLMNIVIVKFCHWHKKVGNGNDLVYNKI